MMDADETISGLVVSVDYAEHLAKGLARWQSGLDRLIVVTARRDEATRTLCRSMGVSVHLTDVFWAKGAKFNKGAAIAEAYRSLEKSDWLLLFDADIEPPEGWRGMLGEATPGNLYGARRVEPDGRVIADVGLAGYFHLAHSSDPNMRRDPIVDTHWRHGGNYDSTFQNRWPKDRHLLLPFVVTHRGETRSNWCGVGNQQAMRDLLKERRRRGGRWDHETV